MGFIINADIDTKLGPTNQLYIRVESFTFNKALTELYFQITYWINQESAINFNRISLDDDLSDASGLVGNRIILYENDLDQTGTTIELPLFIKTNPVVEKEIKTPILKKEKKIKKIPYISFDKNGDEITAYREVEESVSKVVDYDISIKKVIDTNLLTDIYSFMYSELKKKLEDFFIVNLIENSN